MSDAMGSWSSASGNTYIFEEELQSSTPRSLPRNVGESVYVQKQRLASKIFFWLGVGCLLLYVMPFTSVLKYNFLPLGYLQYIAPLCFVVASSVMACRFLEIGRYNYIRNGIPMPVKVVNFEKVPKTVIHGVPSTYCYAVNTEIRDPKTGSIFYKVLPSPEFPAAHKDRYHITLQPEQWITALYLPGKFPKSLQLYGFLELNPNSDLVRQIDKGLANKRTQWSQLFIGLGGIAAIIAIFWDVYVYEHFRPVIFDPVTTGLAITVGVLAFGATVLFSLRSKKTQVTFKTNKRGAIREKFLIPLGISFLVSLTLLSVLFGINALLDSSKPEYKLVKLTRFTQTTYNLIYRTYQIEFAYPALNQTHVFQTTYDHINRFQYDAGFIEIHRGYLGLPWVKQIIPAGPKT